MEDTVRLIVDGKTYEMPIIIGSEGESAIDISKLRRETALITFDPGYVNTGGKRASRIPI
jgi:citrate synthase